MNTTIVRTYQGYTGTFQNDTNSIAVEIADAAGAIQGSFKVESPSIALKAFTQYVDRFLEISNCTHKWVPTWCDTCQLFDICTVCLHRRDCSSEVLSESLASITRHRYDYWRLLDSSKSAFRRRELERAIAIKDRQIEFLKTALESKTVLEQNRPVESAPEQTLDLSSQTTTLKQPHWVETYSPSTRKNHFYYRYCWMEGRKLHHKHVSGGSTASPKANALKEAIEKAIADKRSSQYVLEQILTRR